ncbi:MAG TPA: hypothetical protein VFF76_09705 [Holophagaceae bacterium]|jgi:hypothetical protein|nr:hypothetical protein [Holophagaceae bacterium]
MKLLKPFRAALAFLRLTPNPRRELLLHKWEDEQKRSLRLTQLLGRHKTAILAKREHLLRLGEHLDSPAYTYSMGPDDLEEAHKLGFDHLLGMRLTK